MKRIQKLFLVIMALVTMLSGSVSYVAEAASAGYAFSYSGVTVKIDSKAKKLIKAVGKPVSKSAEKSCAYDGKDYTYKYADFILYAYTKTEKSAKRVCGITFLTNKVKTKEGIKIGSSLDDVIKAYGSATPSMGVYTYTKGKSKLQIAVSDDVVTQIRYVKK